ncbi:hypothetical protein GCM10009828_003720 [Actinoplanes couchii]|uniref:Uncharacterized protein n=2 Tax=Actinoplanes couchii TaxID=403638 RepID=A0ABQ3XN49_9ACTN|nr:hypothetical protein Aco03nite_083040 [Actinoplanes couchii]
MTEAAPSSNTVLSRGSDGWFARSRFSPERPGRAQMSGRSVAGQDTDRPLSLEASALRLAPAVVEVARNVCASRPSERHPLYGVLFCCCGARFHRSESPDARREYMTVCGCRLQPIDAATIEKRVHAAGISFDKAQGPLRTRVAPDGYGRIEVGGTLDDIRFVHRP